MLRIESASKLYKGSDGKPLSVLNGVNLVLNDGETLALLGDSGSGKSTLGQIICGLIRPTSGRIYFRDEPLDFPVQSRLRHKIQILFQHPEVSFNPKLKIIESIKEPYELKKMRYDRNRIADDIAEFGLKPEHLERYPNELSGGELQRLSLARVLVLKPELIILDEPTSMLDVVSQAQILHMLEKYKYDNGTSYIFITHDKLLADKFADRTVRIRDGRLFN